MEIKTKFEVKDHIWVVFENRGEVAVYDTHIEAISYDENGLNYISTECIELREEEIILYKDTEKMKNRVIKIMEEIHEREKK